MSPTPHEMQNHVVHSATLLYGTVSSPCMPFSDFCIHGGAKPAAAKLASNAQPAIQTVHYMESIRGLLVHIQTVAMWSLAARQYLGLSVPYDVLA